MKIIQSSITEAMQRKELEAKEAKLQREIDQI